MYAYSGEAASDTGSEDETSDLAQRYMTNTSTIPILRPIDDFRQLLPKYPEFFERVWPDSLEGVLQPGDMLVLPPGWWHAMRAEGNQPGWSISMWY
jgi:hypothetical protein